MRRFHMWMNNIFNLIIELSEGNLKHWSYLWFRRFPNAESVLSRQFITVRTV